MSYSVFCFCLLIYKRLCILLPRLTCLLLITCYYVVSFEEVSSSSGSFGWATLFYSGTP